MISVNQKAAEIANEMIRAREALAIDVLQLPNGTTVLDAGINVAGSFEAGRLFACASMGGLGRVDITPQVYRTSEQDEFWLPAVSVHVSSPAIACMAAQYAGWPVNGEGFSAIGSGPARALSGDEEIYRQLDYSDQSETAVLMLEGRVLPDERVADYIARKCGVASARLLLLIAPTASLTGSVQIAARSVETGMHKLVELGFDVRKVKAAAGVCPVAPVAADDVRAIGRTNDAILYGSRVHFAVQADDDELARLAGRVPSSSSSDYGTAFYDLFMRHGGDFYQIDRMLFSPAEVQISNMTTGKTFRAGNLNHSLLKASLLE